MGIKVSICEAAVAIMIIIHPALTLPTWPDMDVGLLRAQEGKVKGEAEEQGAA